MSKLEEALEKANKLRETCTEPSGEKIERIKTIEPIKVVNDNIVTINDPNSPVAEEYRRLKSMVIRETKADFLNTIMITSSVDSEGKTLNAINLAVTLAQEIDHSIVLIDADLRRPRIADYLGIEYKYGLSDYLTQDIDVSDVLIKTGMEKLIILPAGHNVANPAELLSSEKMKSLIKDLKHRYMDRYVIIDTPPILTFADGITIGSYVDGIIFIVKEGRAQKKSIEDALNMLKDKKILGVIFNEVNTAGLEGHYSHYYYKYSKRGERKK